MIDIKEDVIAALKGLRSEPGITTFLCYLFGTDGQRSVLSRCPNILSGCYSSADVFLESLRSQFVISSLE